MLYFMPNSRCFMPFSCLIQAHQNTSVSPNHHDDVRVHAEIATGLVFTPHPKGYKPKMHTQKKLAEHNFASGRITRLALPPEHTQKLYCQKKLDKFFITGCVPHPPPSPPSPPHSRSYTPSPNNFQPCPASHKPFTHIPKHPTYRNTSQVLI
jgi:hypothetical protein